MPYVPISGGQILTNCAIFGFGVSYGPVQTADIYIADKFAKNVPLQIFGQNLTPPNGCASTAGGPPWVASQFGANGLLGVDIASVATGYYYSCNTDGSSCEPDSSTSTTVSNPVSKFQNDNNGVTIALDGIPPSGATEPVLGVLIFGVGTQADNTPPEGTVPLQADSSGQINLQIDGNTSVPAIIDSGTPVLSFYNSSLPQCPSGSGYYCPPVPPADCAPTDNTIICLGLSSSGASTPVYDVEYTVGNTDDQTSNDIAFDETLARHGLAFLGLPVFFGRSISFVNDGQQSPLGTGPINAIWAQAAPATQ
jgi:hypothetical protein